MTDFLYSVLEPIVEVMLLILIPAIVAALVRWFQKLGIDVEARHRDALQSALQNAALIAISRGASQHAPAIIVDYVKNSVPDAVKRFGLDDHRIQELALPHLTKITLDAGSTPTTEPAVG